MGFAEVDAALDETRRSGRKVLSSHSMINPGVYAIQQMLGSVKAGAPESRRPRRPYPLGIRITLAAGAATRAPCPLRLRGRRDRAQYTPLSPMLRRVAGNVARGGSQDEEFGNLPIPDDAEDFQRAKVAERERTDGTRAEYEMTMRDLHAFSKGQLAARPAPLQSP